MYTVFYVSCILHFKQQAQSSLEWHQDNENDTFASSQDFSGICGDTDGINIEKAQQYDSKVVSLNSCIFNVPWTHLETALLQIVLQL